MEYDRREPIKGVSGWESTAVTKLTVKQLMEREGAFDQLTQKLGVIPNEVHEKAAALAAAEPQMRGPTALVQPPHMRGPVAPMPVDKSEMASEDEAHATVEPVEPEADEPGGFLRRLFGR